jgi:hypothetical protein
VVAPGTLDPDGMVLAVGITGAPEVLYELLPEGGEFVRAFTRLGEYVGGTPVAVMNLMTAGLNAFAAPIVSASLGIPVLDVDGMGRGYPRLDLTTFNGAGVPAGPLVLSSVLGDVVVLDVTDSSRAEAVARSAISALGGWAATACYPMTIRDACRSGLHGTLARALELGRAAAAAATPAALVAGTGARALGEGRIAHVSRTDAFGYAVADLAGEPPSSLRIEFQSEYLAAAVDGELMATTPDLLIVLRRHDRVPIPCDGLKAGDDVLLMSLPAPPGWQTPAGRRLVGPRAFGYAFEAVA